MVRNQTKKKRHRYLSKQRNKTRNAWYNGGAEEEDGEDDDENNDDHVPDRVQDTDFIFYNPTLNPRSGYVKYIVVNQPAKFLNMFDALGYQFMGIEEQLHALSKNEILVPDYVMHKTIKTDRARSENELAAENATIANKVNIMKKKIKKLNKYKKTYVK